MYFFIFSVNDVWVNALKRLLAFQPFEYRISISVLKYTCSKHNFSQKVHNIFIIIEFFFYVFILYFIIVRLINLM
jgi:hypothetical protein